MLQFLIFFLLFNQFWKTVQNGHMKSWFINWDVLFVSYSVHRNHRLFYSCWMFFLPRKQSGPFLYRICKINFVHLKTTRNYKLRLKFLSVIRNPNNTLDGGHCWIYPIVTSTFWSCRKLKSQHLENWKFEHVVSQGLKTV